MKIVKQKKRVGEVSWLMSAGGGGQIVHLHFLWLCRRTQRWSRRWSLSPSRMWPVPTLKVWHHICSAHTQEQNQQSTFLLAGYSLVVRFLVSSSLLGSRFLEVLVKTQSMFWVPFSFLLQRSSMVQIWVRIRALFSSSGWREFGTEEAFNRLQKPKLVSCTQRSILNDLDEWRPGQTLHIIFLNKNLFTLLMHSDSSDITMREQWNLEKHHAPRWKGGVVRPSLWQS